MQKTTLSQKIMLVVFGFLLTGVILEISLHFAQKLYFVAQDYRNTRVRRGVNQNVKREYKILCLGESTTALGQENSYPRQLERILNQNGMARFVVINKGVPATTTDQILGKLKSYLDEYKPDFVVAMMGVNDTALTPVYQNDLDQQKSLIGFQFKSVKFLEFLGQHLQIRLQELREDFARRKILWAAQAQVKAAPSQGGYFKLADIYGENGAIKDQEKTLIQALNLSRRDPRSYFRLAKYYEDKGDFEKAADQYLQIFGLSGIAGVFKIGAMSALAQCYAQQRKYEQAEKIYQSLIQNSGGRDENKILFYDLLMEMYLDEGAFIKAIDTFQRRIILKPTDVTIYMKIAYAYRKLDLLDELERVLRNGLAVHFGDDDHYALFCSELGYCLLDNKKYAQAVSIFKKLLDGQSRLTDEIGFNVQYGFELAVKGARGEAVDWQRQDDASLVSYYLPTTVANYRQLKEKVVHRGLIFIVAEYPMRSIGSLKRVFALDSNVLFVDNEMSFKKAVAREGYSQYFVDHFAGDFGHGTVKGNALLADQVAAVVRGAL